MAEQDSSSRGLQGWSDFEVGARARSATLVVHEADIIAFARMFDPLPIHVDPAAAAASPFGGITASGAHMFAIRQKLLYDFGYPRDVIASLGADEVRYLAPLRPGSVCQVEIEVLSARESQSRPERGVATLKMTLLADEVPVLTMTDIVLMWRSRDHGRAAQSPARE